MGVHYMDGELRSNFTPHVHTWMIIDRGAGLFAYTYCLRYQRQAWLELLVKLNPVSLRLSREYWSLMLYPLNTLQLFTYSYMSFSAENPQTPFL